MSAPEPPSDIASRVPAVHRVEIDASLSRFYRKSYSPIYFDKSRDGRLNAPDGSYGVLYVAESRQGSFAETFLRRVGNTMIASDFVSERAHVTFRVVQTLTFVKFFGNGLARLGATAEVTHESPPYEIPSRWSAALYNHKSLFDGIAYRSRHNDSELCFAIFGRAHKKIVEHSRQEDLDQDWFYDLAEHHGVGIAP